MKTLVRKVQANAFLAGAILVLVGAVLVSTKAILVKLAYRHDIGMIALLSLRMLFALPVYMVIAYRSYTRQQQAVAVLSRKDWLQIGLIGIIGYYFASMFDFLGLQYITAGLERLILFVYPTLVVLIIAFTGKKPIPGFQVKALLLTYAGILMAFIENVLNNTSPHLVLGTLLVFGCALFYALFMVGSSYYVAKTGSWLFTSMAMMAASGAVLLHQGIAGDQHLGSFDWEVYALALTMAIIATILPTFMISEGIRLVGAGNAAIIGSVGPISTIVLAYIFLDETLGWLQMAGTGLVVAGVLGISLRKTPPSR